MAKGLIHVYTGNGKGKTTSAFGLALRASGHGKRVLILQFLKGGTKVHGEITPAKGAGIELIRFEDQITQLFDKKRSPSSLKKSINNAINLTIEKLKHQRYDLVILDEIITALNSKLITEEDLKKVIDARRDDTELILTGRGAPQWLIEKANYVTEMKKIKHPFDKGIKARKGIEF